MFKTLLIYPGFVIVALLVVAAFITATTYTQLGVAIILYPMLAFFAYKIFLGAKQTPPLIDKIDLQDIRTQTNTTGITDIDKRTFLKLIGATGISFFLISIFGRRIESLISGQNLGQLPGSTGNPQAGKTVTAAAAPTDGYNISETDDGIVSYYGFTNKEGGWFIMKGDADSGSFRYIKGKSNFPSNWNNRENLKYDYFYEAFP